MVRISRTISLIDDPIQFDMIQNPQQRYYLCLFEMEFMGNLASYMIVSRNQMDYTQHSENINKLIEEMGEKVQKDLVALQQTILLNFKDNLLSAQKEYNQLQKQRNDEIIKEKVLHSKNQQEKIFNQEEQKSMGMNKLYDKIKIDLKKNVQYEHELALEVKFLTRQIGIALKKQEILDEEVKEYKEGRRHEDKIETTMNMSRTYHLPTLKKTNPFRSTSSQMAKTPTLTQKRIRCKIQSMKEYLQFIKQDDSKIQKIFGKYDISSVNTSKERIEMIETIFEDKGFKKYLYEVLFKEKASNSTVK